MMAGDGMMKENWREPLTPCGTCGALRCGRKWLVAETE